MVEEIVKTTRRETVAALAATGAAALLLPGGLARAVGEKSADAGGGLRAGAGKHAPVPQPFDPKQLRGLSERLIVSHHENNYGGALRNLNAVEQELARVTKETPGFVVAGLRERELAFANSVILHELYFANLGGDGKPAGAVRDAIAAAFGSAGRWEELFRTTGMSLAGGSGWALLELDLYTGELRVGWSGNHTQAPAHGCPLLVLDMYEHAYHLDYGAAAARYVDAFFANLRWEEVERRHARALQALAALRA
jgi:Fe-Mn family superoxide dismutase